MKGIDRVTMGGKDFDLLSQSIAYTGAYTEAYVEQLKKEFEVEKREAELQTLQDLFLDINKKEPLTDENWKVIGVKELTLNDVKKIILDKIKELGTNE